MTLVEYRLIRRDGTILLEGMTSAELESYPEFQREFKGEVIGQARVTAGSEWVTIAVFPHGYPGSHIHVRKNWGPGRHV